MLQLFACGETQAPPTGQSTLIPSSILPSKTISSQVPEAINQPLGSTTPSQTPQNPNPSYQQPVDYITIKGVEYSTSLTSLELVASGLSDEDIVPLRYMKNLKYWI
jgi:hypothetical protein